MHKVKRQQISLHQALDWWDTPNKFWPDKLVISRQHDMYMKVAHPSSGIQFEELELQKYDTHRLMSTAIAGACAPHYAHDP